MYLPQCTREFASLCKLVCNLHEPYTLHLICTVHVQHMYRYRYRYRYTCTCTGTVYTGKYAEEQSSSTVTFAHCIYKSTSILYTFNYLIALSAYNYFEGLKFRDFRSHCETFSTNLLKNSRRGICSTFVKSLQLNFQKPPLFVKNLTLKI